MKNRPVTATVILMSILAISSLTYANVKLPAIFGDHMVLQQKEKVTVWGWADPGEKVSVKGSWQWFDKKTKADENGTWKVSIKTPKAGKTVSLSVKGNNQVTVKDILIGEVWICSGQSNMQWTMGRLGTQRGNEDIEKSDLPNIRLFTVKRVLSTTPKEDVEGTWEICTPEVVKNFSATGFYFGKNLNENLNVPVGLISTNWGGTKAEAWTSRETLADFEPFEAQLAMLADPDKNITTGKKNFQKQLKKWEENVGNNDPGVQEKWYASNYDDSGWKEVELPCRWSDMDLGDVDGIAWYRRTTNLPPSWARNNLELHLGPVDDIATVWVNGTALGTTIGWDQKRVYQVPSSVLRTGKNTIAVRVIDTGGKGGFGGAIEDMFIGPKGISANRSARMSGTWRYQLSSKAAVPPVPTESQKINQNTPTALYNGMIAPLLNVRIAGAIWYQGESNCYDPILYRTLFPAMITDWRTHWGQGDFPFYYVQIAPFEYGKDRGPSQALREAQMMTLDAVDNVGMAVLMDIGEEKDIHPKNKHDVGDRLARWALAKTYGKKNVVYSGPIYKTMSIEGNKIRISLSHTDGGLVAKDGGLSDFMIAGADQKFVSAEAVIDGDTVVVSSDEVKEPVAVRYGWSNWVDGSLFNKAGLPASSFRTDDWPLE